jgi:hypothetical protein
MHAGEGLGSDERLSCLCPVCTIGFVCGDDIMMVLVVIQYSIKSVNVVVSQLDLDKTMMVMLMEVA